MVTLLVLKNKIQESHISGDYYFTEDGKPAIFDKTRLREIKKHINRIDGTAIAKFTGYDNRLNVISHHLRVMDYVLKSYGFIRK